MTSVGVKALNLFQDSSMSVKSNAQSVDQSESFDDTFSSMKMDKKYDRVDENRVKEIKGDDAKIEELSAAKTRNPVKPEEEISDEQMVAAAEEVIAQIQQVLMERFEISIDELETAIQEIGLTKESLMNPVELTQVVMKLEGIENPTDMLTNPDFVTDLREILTEAESIMENVKAEDFTADDVKLEEADVEVNEMPAMEQSAEVTEDEISTDVEDSIEKVEMDKPETTVMENISNETASDSEDSNGLLKHEEPKATGVTDENPSQNQAIQPQDFAAKLTEDLSQKVGETRAEDIVRQVVEQTQLQVKQGVTSMEMQLYPEHLGKVLIQVVSHDGSITAQITAESEAAKSALESQLTLLKENLINQGVKVGNVEVTIASHAFDQNMQGERHNEQGASQGRRSRRNAINFFDDANDEGMETESNAVLESIGSTVSYSA